MKHLGPSLRVVQLTEDVFELAEAVCRAAIHSRDFDTPPEGEAGNSPRFRLLAEFKQKLKGLPVDFYDETKPGTYLLIDTFKRPEEWSRPVRCMFVNYGRRPYPLRIMHVLGCSAPTNAPILESLPQTLKFDSPESLSSAPISGSLDPFIDGTGYMTGGGHGRRAASRIDGTGYVEGMGHGSRSDKWPPGTPEIPPLD